MYINHDAAKQFQQCKEQEKMYRETNEVLAKQNQKITMMEKEMTAMKEEMKKREREFATMKKELKITKNVLKVAEFQESKDRCFKNQKDKVIEKNDLLINELKDENQRLSDQTLCGICYTEKIQVVFIPCRHFYCCQSCASFFSKCPVCKEDIINIVAVFWGK